MPLQNWILIISRTALIKLKSSIPRFATMCGRMLRRHLINWKLRRRSSVEPGITKDNENPPCPPFSKGGTSPPLKKGGRGDLNGDFQVKRKQYLQLSCLVFLSFLMSCT